MAKVFFETQIKATTESVYRVSQDYSVRYDWDPFPEKIQLLGGATSIEKGSRVLVVAKSGLKMTVEFIQLQPPHTAAIKMVSGPFFLQSFSGSWIFKESGNGLTTAKFVYSIKSKPWALPFIVDNIAALYFSKLVKARLMGLKYYCEQLKDISV